MSHKCKVCGKPLKKGFERCYDCYQAYERDRLARLMVAMKGLASDEPDGSPMCVMCGKEWGTRERDDGKYYCAQCWTIWNS